MMQVRLEQWLNTTSGQAQSTSGISDVLVVVPRPAWPARARVPPGSCPA